MIWKINLHKIMKLEEDGKRKRKVMDHKGRPRELSDLLKHN